MNHTCECCGEREAVTNNGTQWLCFDCAKPQCCSHCDRELTDGEADGWQIGDSDSVLCVHCQAENAEADELDELQQAVERAAKEHGWSIAEIDHAAESRSRYLTIERGKDRLVVRVSDHATAYCREDISLCTKNASGDDHALADLIERLK